LAVIIAGFAGLKFHQFRQRNPSIWPGSSKNSASGLGAQHGNYGGVAQNLDHVDFFKSEMPMEYGMAELPAVDNMAELPAENNMAELPTVNHRD